MINFLKDYEFKNFKIKLLLLYILDLTDIIFTQFFLFKAPEMFMEVNPAMKPIITDYQGILLKIFLPIVVFVLWYYDVKKDYTKKINSNSEEKIKALNKDLKSSNIVFLILFIFYSIINVMHLVSMVIYIITAIH